MDLKELRKEMNLKELTPRRKGNIQLTTNVSLPLALAKQFLSATEAKGIAKARWIEEAIIEKLKKEK